MKKILSLLLAVIIAASVCSVAVYAATDNITVYVSISDGALRIGRGKVHVRDIDGGGISVYDTLYCAHEQYYPDGAQAGFEAETTIYGLSLKKLWGKENNYTYGYYINDEAANSLADPVKEGDDVFAFAYTDVKNWTDSYTFFDSKVYEADAYDYIDVTLYCYKFDMVSFKFEKIPVAGAAISIDGASAKAVTDENGKATITALKPGTHVISASCEDMLIVPPASTLQSNGVNIFGAVKYYINAAIDLIINIFNYLKLQVSLLK